LVIANVGKYIKKLMQDLLLLGPFIYNHKKSKPINNEYTLESITKEYSIIHMLNVNAQDESRIVYSIKSFILLSQIYTISTNRSCPLLLIVTTKYPLYCATY